MYKWANSISVPSLSCKTWLPLFRTFLLENQFDRKNKLGNLAPNESVNDITNRSCNRNESRVKIQRKSSWYAVNTLTENAINIQYYRLSYLSTNFSVKCILFARLHICSTQILLCDTCTNKVRFDFILAEMKTREENKRRKRKPTEEKGLSPHIKRGYLPSCRTLKYQ